MKRLAVFFVCLLLALPFSLIAQTTGGTVSGTVTDESGSNLPGVTVTAQNLATRFSRTAVSNESGFFTIPSLPPGIYDVTAELDGFRSAKASAVTVNIGSEVSLAMKLHVGLEETVTVTAEAPVVDTTRSQVSSVVNEKAIANLPTNGRNFIDFVLTTPGVVKDVRQGDISFAGQRGTLNSLVVDGANNDNTFFGQALGRTGSGRAPYQFSQDAVKEFQVNSNAYSAEYGRAGGAVINVVTKSGTNDVSGTAFYFVRDEDYNANNYINVLNKRPKGPYHYDQYGASVGGPIVRDRHFFFVNYDAQRNTQPNLVVLNLPSSTPTDADTLAGIERLRALANSYERTQDQDVLLLKTDHELFRNSHLSFRFNRQEFTGGNFENGGITNSEEHTGDSLVETDTLSAVFSSPISSSLFNEVRVQYAKDHEPGKANSANPEATIRQGGQTVLVIGRNFFSPRETTIERNQIADTVTWLRGNHTLKTGFDINQDDILNYFPGNFSGSYTFNSIASFHRGRPNGSGERYVQAFPGPGTSGPTTTPNMTEYAFFVQDEWRTSSNLTLHAGVRYDFQDIEQPDVQNPDAQLLAAGIDTSVVPEDDDNYGLRLGFAYTPFARSVIRGGYGTFYGRTPAIMVGTAHSNNGINVRTITFTGSQVPTYPNIFSSLPTGVTLPPTTILVFDRDFENPVTHQASVGYEHGITNDISIGVSYLYVKGDDLPRSTDINVGDASLVDMKIIEGGVQTGTVPVKRYSRTRPFTNFARVIEFQSSANSEYNGFTLDVNKRFSANWQARLAYTYGVAKDDRPDATAVVPQGSDDAKYAEDPLNLDGDWAYSDNDVRHRVTLSGVYFVGAPDRFKNRFLAVALGNWTISGIVNYQTGQPYSALVNADLNNDGNTRNDRAPGTKRNQFRFEDQFTVDPRITRDIGLWGDTKVQLIVEAFNVFNEENVSGVRNTLYSFDATKNELTKLNTGSTAFGIPTASAGERIVQLAAKFTF